MTVETGLSDCHKMTVTVMKKYFKKREPITIIYRDYKSFDGVKFRDELKKELIKAQVITIEDFISIFKEVLERHAPTKKRVIRGNQAPFMNKTLSKAFMTRARLRNKYYKNNTPENKHAYTKHKNFCINLLERERKKYYNELDTTIFASNKKFWDRVKPLFSDKTVLKHNLCLKEGGKMISDKKEVAEILNNYFMESVENLEVERYMPTIVIEDNECGDDIDRMIKKFQDHPSIQKINENVKIEESFKFRDVTEEETFNKLISLDPSKACMKDDIPTKVILGTGDIVSSTLTTIFNNAKNEEFSRAFENCRRNSNS